MALGLPDAAASEPPPDSKLTQSCQDHLERMLQRGLIPRLGPWVSTATLDLIYSGVCWAGHDIRLLLSRAPVGGQEAPSDKQQRLIKTADGLFSGICNIDYQASHLTEVRFWPAGLQAR